MQTGGVLTPVLRVGGQADWEVPCRWPEGKVSDHSADPEAEYSGRESGSRAAVHRRGAATWSEQRLRVP